MSSINERVSKFQQVYDQYTKYLSEDNQLPPIAPINQPGNTNSTPSVSAIDKVIDTDPNVINAKKKAADAAALQIKKQANTVTNP